MQSPRSAPFEAVASHAGAEAAMRRAIGVMVCGIALTLLALIFDAAPLFVPGLAFFVIGIVAPAWVWCSARPASVRRRLGVERVVEGEPLEAMIEVRRGFLGLPGAELRDPLAPGPVVLKVPMSLIQGDRVADVRIVTRFLRRGLQRLEPPALVVRDPLALATLAKGAQGPRQEVLVLPYTEPVRWRTRESGRRSQRTEGRSFAEPMAAVDVDGLRPYRPGTPASRIHWSALARGAGLLERRLRADRDTRPVVVLDARGVSHDEQLDAPVRAAASLTLELARQGGCRLLLPGERRALVVEPDLGSWPAAHARLALVQSGPDIKPPLLDGAMRLGPVFYVAAQPFERLPVALSTPGRGGVVLVLPKELDAAQPSSPSFEVTGCYGFAVRTRAGSRDLTAA
jgi:uncharacterized protein (DUF58 family)